MTPNGSSCNQIVGQLYPTPPLAPEVKERNLARFSSKHELAAAWDGAEEVDGHVVLQWREPALGLGVVVVLGKSSFTVDIARFTRTNRSWRRRQSISAEMEYQHQCRDLTAALAEISLHREKKRAPEKSLGATQTPNANPSILSRRTTRS